MRVACPVCGWVKPLHPHQPMTTCPCGWVEGDEVPVKEPVQLELEVTVEVTTVFVLTS